MRLGSTQSNSQMHRARRNLRRIDRIYGALDDVVDLLGAVDPELQDAILDWMDRADQASSGNIHDHIESTLTEFETTYEMRRVAMDGTKEFPEDCSDCPHYGVACPLFHDRANRIERKRLQEDLVGATEEETKQAYRKLAGRVSCTVIVDEIEDWENEHSSLLEDGRDLRRRSHHVLRPQDDEEAATEAAADSLDVATGGER